MAVKAKNEVQQSRLMKYLVEEQKWEVYALGLLGCLSIALGSVILTGALDINPDVPVIGSYPLVFAWLVVILGAIGLVLVLIPFFKPAVPEIKKLSYPTKSLFLGNIIRVFIFITVLALVFVLYEAFISTIMGEILK